MMAAGPAGLGLATDIMVLGDRATLTRDPLGWVMRCPAEPDFWFGNQLILAGSPPDAETAVAAFRAAFPQAAHVVLSWDRPGRSLAPDLEWLAERGFVIETNDVLVLAGPVVPVPRPEGIALRRIGSGADWAAVEALQIETGIEEGYDKATYAPFMAGRVAAWRDAVAQGRGDWFGAFDAGLLVADLGLFSDGRIARFQAVETRATHRRRGICAALVAYAVSPPPAARVVIVAEAEGAAGRIYRRLGFALEEAEVSALLRPADA